MGDLRERPAEEATADQERERDRDNGRQQASCPAHGCPIHAQPDLEADHDEGGLAQHLRWGEPLEGADHARQRAQQQRPDQCSGRQAQARPGPGSDQGDRDGKGPVSDHRAGGLDLTRPQGLVRAHGGQDKAHQQRRREHHQRQAQILHESHEPRVGVHVVARGHDPGRAARDHAQGSGGAVEPGEAGQEHPAPDAEGQGRKGDHEQG